jgi:hypothetical protein
VAPVVITSSTNSHRPIGDAVTLVLWHGKRACQIALSLASA